MPRVYSQLMAEQSNTLMDSLTNLTEKFGFGGSESADTAKEGAGITASIQEMLGEDAGKKLALGAGGLGIGATMLARGGMFRNLAMGGALGGAALFAKNRLDATPEHEKGLQAMAQTVLGEDLSAKLKPVLTSLGGMGKELKEDLGPAAKQAGDLAKNAGTGIAAAAAPTLGALKDQAAFAVNTDSGGSLGIDRG